RHTRCLSDWSSDVCSSDLGEAAPVEADGDGGVVEVAELLELRVDRRLPCRVDADRLLGEKPAGRVVLVRGHVEQESSGRQRILRSEERRVGEEGGWRGVER